MKTRDRILSKAVELMNKNGLENVSTYDIARELKIRQSNITYYFPSKSDLINALCKRMIEDINKAAIPDTGEFSFQHLYRLIDRVMQQHVKYRFILMNYAAIITADKELNQHFIDVLETRHGEFESIVNTLEGNGYLNGAKMRPYLRPVLLMLNMLAIYWIQEAAIYNADKSDEEKRRHHLKLLFQIYIPYLTKKGEDNLFPLLLDTAE